MRPRTTEEWQRLAEQIQEEGPISASKAAARIPASCRRNYGGKRQHASTGSVVRWIVHGLRGVRLDGAMLNGEGWFTSVAAIARFQAELSRKAVAGVEAGRVSETPRQRETRAEAAGRELDEWLGE